MKEIEASMSVEEDTSAQISAIIFLGVCAPFIKNKTIVANVSKKILNLFRTGSENIQRSLGKSLPELMNFF